MSSPDAAAEQALTALNTAIHGTWTPSGATDQSFFAVVGLPRSGTTLLTQRLAKYASVKALSNFVALFWANPAIGFAIRDILPVEAADQDLTSAYGRTTGLDGPHEAGRLWMRLLAYSSLADQGPAHTEHIDWEQFGREIKAMTVAANSNVVAKAFHIGFHVSEALFASPQLRIVRIHRPLAHIADSLLTASGDYGGAAEGWVGVRPKAWSTLTSLPLLDRVCLQALTIERIHSLEVSRAIDAGHGHRIFDVQMADLVHDPDAATSAILRDEPAPLLSPEHALGFAPSPNQSDRQKAIRKTLETYADGDMVRELALRLTSGSKK